MPLFLRHRQRLPELMDDPALDAVEHRRALDALGRAGIVSRTAPSIWPAIRNLSPLVPDRPIRVLDVACGGGHLMVSLARLARRDRVAIECVGCDVSPVAAEYVRVLADRAGLANVVVVQENALCGALLAPYDSADGAPRPQSREAPGLRGFDVVISSLFLHHLDGETAVEALARMRRAARHLVIVSDLRRTPLGFVFAWVGCRLLARSRVFHVDGARSVRAAFTIAESRMLARAAGLDGADVAARWPQRFVLTWRRSASNRNAEVLSDES